MKIAIRGHESRGKEVIKILESLGGKNIHDLCGSGKDYVYHYHIDSCGTITFSSKYDLHNYKFYTLEEFEKEFPFKVGDIVTVITDTPYKIVALEYYFGRLCYKLDNGLNYNSKDLKPYKEMKERNITLTLDKAKEWYKKGGELKEIALQAFSKKELNPLPRSWEDYSEKYCIKKGEAYINSEGKILTFTCNTTKRIWDNICPSQKSAEAHLAMIQLEQLRDCWRQGWEPMVHESIYAIKFSVKGLLVYNFSSREFLSFPTREMAEEFLECFRDLIEKAGDLI